MMDFEILIDLLQEDSNLSSISYTILKYLYTEYPEFLKYSSIAYDNRDIGRDYFIRVDKEKPYFLEIRSKMLILYKRSKKRGFGYFIQDFFSFREPEKISEDTLANLFEKIKEYYKFLEKES